MDVIGNTMLLMKLLLPEKKKNRKKQQQQNEQNKGNLKERKKERKITLTLSRMQSRPDGLLFCITIDSLKLQTFMPIVKPSPINPRSRDTHRHRFPDLDVRGQGASSDFVCIKTRHWLDLDITRISFRNVSG